jgi:hypothetical protein
VGKGVTADELVRAAIHKMIAEATETQAPGLPVWHLGSAGAIPVEPGLIDASNVALFQYPASILHRR